MKKILFYSERWMDGGIEKFIMTLINNINNKNISFEILTSQKETDTYDNMLKKSNVRINILHLKKIENPILRTMLSLIKLNKKLKNKKLDLIHINIYNSVGLFYAYIAKLNGFSNIIVHCHNSGIDSDKFYIKRLSNFIFKKLFTSKKYTYLACSMEAAEFCINLKRIPSTNVIIIKNGIDTKLFLFNSKIRKKRRKELNIDENTILFGNVARFVEQKNHQFLIDVFYKIQIDVPNSKLLLIGTGPLLEKIKIKCKDLKVFDKVIFLGNTPDVNEYLQAMDFFLFPSLYEGLGIALIEAQASGLLCATSFGVPRDVAITPNIYFLNCHNVNEWTDLILSKIPYKRRNMMNECKLSGFDIKDSVKKVNEIYKEMLSIE